MELLIFLLLVLLVDLATDPLGGCQPRSQRPSSQCENPMTSLEAFSILLASLNRLFAMERSR